MTGRALGLVLLAAACSPRPAADAPDARAPAPAVAATDSTLITLERTPCLGVCPVYTVSISGGGAVRFVGRQHTAHIGEADATVPPARVDSLLAELRVGGYFGFADAYVQDAPACGLYATDSPSAITSVTAGGERKQIRHDYGCSDAPRGLARLETRIDEVAGTGRWTGR